MPLGQRVCASSDVGPGEAQRFEVDGAPVAVARDSEGTPVSYTHLTLPTILLV